MIHATPFVVIDLETTGLEPRLDRIVEIGAVKLLNGEIVGEWSTLVNPGVFVPQETTHITGITTEMVQDAPFFTEIHPQLMEFIGEGSVFVAHNAEFDRSFLNNTLLRHQLEGLDNPYLCTFKLAKQVHPNLSAYSLGALTTMFEIPLVNAHRALDDARATALLLKKFLKVLHDGGLRQLKDLPQIQNLPKMVETAQGQGSLF